MRKKNQRLTEDEKMLLKKLTLEGDSLSIIMKKTGLGKTTIHYNVKKYKARQKKELINNLSDEKVGQLMGAFAGDGSYYYWPWKIDRGGLHRVKYNLSLKTDLNYALHLFGLLRQLNLNPFISKRIKKNLAELCVNSQAYIEFIREFLIWEGKRTYSIRLKQGLDKYSEEFLKGFVRGLMDTDGYVEVSNVSCGCTSRRLMKNLAAILDKFDLKYKWSVKKREPLRRDLYLIRIYRNSLESYHKIIGFSNKYKLKSLEKILMKNGAARI